jgi:hypothetical protein
MYKTYRGIFCAVALLFGLLPTTALAETNEVQELRQLVQTLQQQLQQQQQQIQLLLDRTAAAKPAGEATLAEAASSEDSSQSAKIVPAVAAMPSHGGGGGEGAWWRSRRLHIGGYGSFRYEASDVPDSKSGFTFRRFVVTTDSQITDRLRVYSETELERLLELELEKSAQATDGGVKFESELEGNSGAELGLEQMWMQFDLGKKQAVRGGIVLPPIGRYNIHHDDDYWDIARRTLTDRNAPVVPVPVAWRELGLGWVGSAPVGSSGKLDFQAYVLSGAALDFNIENVVQTRTPDTNKLALESSIGLASGAVDGSNSADAAAWRVAYSPTLAGEIAVSGYHGRYTPDWITARQNVNSFAVDGKWRFGAFETEGEFAYSDFGRVGQVAQSLAQAVYNSEAALENSELENEIEIEMKGLTSRKWGFWTDAKYHWRPDWLKNSFLGFNFEDPQLIPIVRYERVWLDSSITGLDFSSGVINDLTYENFSQDRITAGVNYRPSPQVGFQFAYERNNRRGGSRMIYPDTDRSSTNGFLAGWTFGF